MKRSLIPSGWNRHGRAVADPNASELDNVVPLRAGIPIQMTSHPVSRGKRLRRALREFVDFILAPCWGR